MLEICYKFAINFEPHKPKIWQNVQTSFDMCWAAAMKMKTSILVINII